MMRLTLLLVFFVMACVPQSGTLVSPHTGLSGHYSRQVVISDHPHHVLYGHVITARRDTDTLRALVVSQRRDGVHNLRIQEAWSHGVQLPFRRAGGLDGCSHGHCLNRHVGFILLSEPLFTHARTQGLDARLLSGTDNITVSIPATLFDIPNP